MCLVFICRGLRCFRWCVWCWIYVCFSFVLVVCVCLLFIFRGSWCVFLILYVFCLFTFWFLCLFFCMCGCVWLIRVYFLLQSAQSLYYNKEIMKRTLGRPTYAFEARQYVVSVWDEKVCVCGRMSDSWSTFLTDVTSFDGSLSQNI